MADKNKKIRRPFDFVVLITVLILLSIGSVMVLSSGAPHAANAFGGDTYYFLKKQLLYVPIGLICMFVIMNINYKKIGKISPILLVISILLLVLVAIPGIGSVHNGARRWLNIGTSFQPSEFAKFTVILFFSYAVARKKEGIEKFKTGLLPFLGILMLFSGLLLLEPHLSATVIIGSVAMMILFIGGAKIKHFVAPALPILFVLALLIMSAPYRLKRLTSFLDPWSDIKGSGWQIVQSLYAIGSGGVFGRGIGKSLQKFLYIPEPYNDFILAVLAEELGFIGVVTVLLLFLVLVWRGIKIAINAPDMFGCLVATGVTFLIAFQVLINVAVVSSSMPVTGMPLPFFSFGGTSLIFLLCGIGVLLNVSKYSKYERI